MDKLFIADEEDVRNGYTMDVYFERTKRILEAKGLDESRVCAELTSSSLPRGWEWAVFCGLEEVIRLSEGTNVSVYAIPEGTIIRARTPASVRVPVMNFIGNYVDFGIMETAILGMICQPTGVATKASRVKIAAQGKPVIAFGNRRMHPAIAGVLDRSAYIGGCDDVSSGIGGDIIGKEPLGTVPHALTLMMGSNDAAFRAFDEIIDPRVPRIMLIDTFSDERSAAIEACRSVKNLVGVRLDTPGSRRGNFKELIDEVRWEMDMNGYKHVKIIVSGGLDEESVAKLADTCVSSFGVGTSIANAPTLDFSMDLVEKDGEPIAKRGKFAGRKFPYRCPHCYTMGVSLIPDDEIRCDCGCVMEMIERPVLKNGKRVTPEVKPKEVREYVLKQLDHMKQNGLL
ncbi:MAG: nicotinate phosphoribosyltransferase [Candidatus Methanomethylophilaceae archaeon]|nr:nicotinate phosphoribosyltransferase [Candidatus Methanomethylophilaceae archaeon]